MLPGGIEARVARSELICESTHATTPVLDLSLRPDHRQDWDAYFANLETAAGVLAAALAADGPGGHHVCLPAAGASRRGPGGGGVRPGDEVTVHQLLGRIAYFHALFIEPALAPAPAAASRQPCCHTPSPCGDHAARGGGILAGAAWAILEEIAITLGATSGRCPSHRPGCCSKRRVGASAAAVAEAWLATEHRAYQRPERNSLTRQACREAAATRLTRVFVLHHHAPCPAAQVGETAGAWLLPCTDELPLTGELLALWRVPLAGGGSAVVSWLNHCADLDDIRRVLEARRPTP